MKICANCGAQIPDDAAFCNNCGSSVSDSAAPKTAGVDPAAANGNNQQPGFGQPQPQPQPQPQYQQPQYQQPYPAYDPTDHTAEMDPQDISDNKLFAIVAYIMGLAGIIVALLAAKDSKFVGFHVRQVLKLSIIEALITLITLVLCWTIIVPIVACICIVILLVLQIIGFVNACSGKAKELPIISSFGFLK